MYHLDACDFLSFDNFIPLCRWKWDETSASFVNHDQQEACPTLGRREVIEVIHSHTT
jgi:hypothetical protein